MVKSLKISFIILILAVIAGATGWYFHYSAWHPSTDDAYVKGHIVNIATQINGQVASVNIKNHQLVAKGQLLLTIDPKPIEIALTKAQAQLQTTRESIQALSSAVKASQAQIKQRQAELINARKSAQRIFNLTKQHVYPESQKDSAISQLRVAQAALQAARAQYQEALANLGDTHHSNAKIAAAQTEIANLKLQLSYTKIYAPTSGYINNLTLRQGDMVNAYQALFALVGNQHWWVTANFKETQLQHIKAGQPVTITLDMYPDHQYQGKVISISSGSGSAFALLPAENATGNWVKVTQRFPVWVSIKDSTQFPLRVGASATVTVATR